LLEACQALAAQASVDLAVLVLAALDSVDPDSVDLVVLVAAHPALALVALAALALVALAVRASVDLSVHVVLISKSGSIPLGSEVLHDAHRVDPQGSEGRASIFQKVVGAEFGVDDNDRCVERFGGLVTDERLRFFRQHAGVENH
jgi:hypothetical protein